MVTINHRTSRAYPALIITAICLVITFCEWVFAYQDVAYGIVLALLLALIIYVIVPLVKLGQAFADCAESLVLIPLYILFTSSLPWFFLSQEFLIPAVYSAVLALCAWHIYRKNVSLKDIGFRSDKMLWYILLGIMVGFLWGPPNISSSPRRPLSQPLSSVTCCETWFTWLSLSASVRKCCSGD